MNLSLPTIALSALLVGCGTGRNPVSVDSSAGTTVTVRFEIGQDRKAKDISIVSGKGPDESLRRFEEHATAQVRKWTFDPELVGRTVQIPMQFHRMTNPKQKYGVQAGSSDGG